MMMTMGSWKDRIREARPLRDVLGVILVAATALLYAAERHRAEAAEGPSEVESAVVVEATGEADLPPAETVLETALAPSPKQDCDRG